MKTPQNRTVLSGMTYQELEKFVTGNNEPKFRAKQLHYWLYKKSAAGFDQMTSLSKSFRDKLNDIALISSVKIRQKLKGEDGTLKYLLEYPDNNAVEAVLMSYDKRPNLTACLSTQIGCAMGCAFCATGKNGLVRNLSAPEIVEQILAIQRDTGQKITNIVFMGQGEPLLNYDETVRAVNIINSDLETGMRRITVSTCGIVPGIYRLAEVNRQLVLALSLHAPEHELRKRLMPIENKYPIHEAIEAMKFYSKKTGRRVTIEYILIKNVNDSTEHARQLNTILKDLKYNINLIPYNPVEGCGFERPSAAGIKKFREELERINKKVTVRQEKGTDISAACGQLAGNIKK